MRFILTSGWEDGIADLTERLINELHGGKKVLWLVSGGSNIPASVEIMNSISADLSKNLTILPADERYGEVGHANSNLRQLYEAGFEPHDAQVVPVLHNLSFEDTAYYYNKLTKELFSKNSVVLAQLGMGDDGHVAGVLPGTAQPEGAWTVSYQAPDYDRLSLSFLALKKVSVAYVFAFGANKRQALINLRDKKLPLGKQPVQVLKSIPEVYLYNDQVGDK